MGSHPTVQMVSEKVTMTIHRDHADVDCLFVFKNHGAKATVRMGFPDWDSNHEPGDGPILERFRSKVDGKPVKTYLLFGGGQGWHIKHVAFSKGQTRTVRNQYRVKLGALALNVDGMTRESKYVQSASYIVSTGASWKGVIEKTEIVLVFARDARVGKGSVRAVADLQLYQSPASKFWEDRRDLIWAESGPGKPTVRGRTLRYVRTNWKPTENEDLLISFGVKTVRW